jgi:outer membrane protein TolC
MQFGLNFGLPLRLRTARGLMKEAQSKIKQMNIQEKQLLQAIFLDIENAYSQIDTSYDRYLFSQKEYALAQKLEEGERLRFELGDSTLFLLIQRERMTIESRIDMIKALGDYNYALVNFDIVQAKF